LYQVALTFVPQIGAVQIKTLIENFKTASSIFKAKRSLLEKVDGIGTIRAKSILQFSDFEKAEKELEFIEKYKIQPLFLTEKLPATAVELL
jgi:DNA processing protein